MTDEGREPLRFLVLAASLRAGSLNARLAELAATVMVGGNRGLWALRVP